MPANKVRRENRQAFGLADLKRLNKEAAKAAEAKRKQAAAAAAQASSRTRDDASGLMPRHSAAPVLSSEDIQLFRRSMKTVTPIKDTHRAILTLPPVAGAEQLRQRRERAIGQEPIRLQPTSDHYSPAKTDADATRYLSAGYGPDVLKGLKRGKWPITASIDLHGNTLEQARERLDRFLTTCLQHHIKCVRIVHGKGYGSKDGEPVLKQTIRRWLTQIAGVIAYMECAESDGGAGAVQVLLQSNTPET